MREIDVHGLTVAQAKSLIESTLNYAVRKKELSIAVIHGFHEGNRIKTMLHNNGITHPSIIRVRSKIDNPGITIIDLRMKID